MDDADKTLFREAIDAVLRRRSAADVSSVLVEEGWDEVRADDEAFALGALFESAGRVLSDAPLLDLAVAPIATGARPVVRRTVMPDDTEELLALGAPVAGADLLVDAADGTVLRVPADRLEVSTVRGLDPDLAVHRYRGHVMDTGPVPGADAAALRALLRRCLGHQLVGLAERAQDTVREYVLTRKQFGREIGTWQTVQHRLADTHVEITAARAMLDAAWNDPHDVVSAAAKAQAALGADVATGHAQQLLGAIGFTWEHDIHRAVRRANLLDAALGSRFELNDEITDHLLSDADWEPIVVDL